MEVITEIQKKYGEHSIQKLGDSGSMSIPVIPSGSLKLDEVLGVGGFPRGRIIEVFGKESSGKTTLCLHVMSQAQSLGGQVAFIDFENALDPVYAKSIGVDVSELYLSQPDNGEEGLDILESLVRSGDFDVICIDSVAAMVPRAEIEGDMGDSHMGLHARLMSQAMRKLTGAINRTKTVVIFTNQIRMKIGMVFGNPETTTGGMALRFYATMRLETKYIGQVKVKDETMGSQIRVTVKKSKVSPPFKVAETEIRYGSGFDIANELLDYGEELGFTKKAGAWYSFLDVETGEELGKVSGRENAKVELYSNPDLFLAMENQVRSHLRLPIKKG